MSLSGNNPITAQVSDDDKILNPYWDSTSPVENPRLRYVTPLCQLFALTRAATDLNLRPVFINKLKKLLSQDFQDPNVEDRQASAVGMALQFHDIELIKILFIYGGRPTPTLIRIVLSFQRHDVYKLIVKSFFQPERPLTSLLKVSDFTIHTKNQRMFTQINSTNAPNTVLLELCNTSLLSKDELAEIFKLYSDFFESSKVSQSSLKDFFDFEVKAHPGQLKFYEDIRIGKDRVGGSLYEIIILPDEPDVIILHISCIYMKECVRGKGLTNPLAMTLPYVLQALFPNKTVVCAYQSVSMGSFNLVNGLTHFPKYETEYLSKLADKLIPHLQRYGALTHGPMKCYSEIEVQVVAKDLKKQPDKVPLKNTSADSKNSPADSLGLKEWLFSYLKDTNNPGEEIHRGILVMILLGNESLAKHCKLYWEMGLDPNRYISSVLKEFIKIVPELKIDPINDKKKIYFPHSLSLFREKRRIPSTSFMEVDAGIDHSKLLTK